MKLTWEQAFQVIQDEANRIRGERVRDYKATELEVAALRSSLRRSGGGYATPPIHTKISRAR